MGNPCAVILAAGKGSRMKSEHPKVLLNVLFKPMLQWVIDSVNSSDTAKDICVVVGHKREMVEQYLGGKYPTAYQETPKGTAHAVMVAKSFLEEHRGEDVLVLCGDAPLMDSETLKLAYEQHIREGNSATVISAVLDDPTGYGRVIREGGTGRLLRIVEHKDATDGERRICEINSGAYWFKIDDILPVLDTDHIKASSKTGEYYLPDIIKILMDSGKNVSAYTSENVQSVLGANDFLQLNNLNAIARDNIISKLLSNGVEMPDSTGIIIGPDVKIGTDVTILPGTSIKGKSEIADGCVIGPNTLIDNCTVGRNVIINASQCTGAIIGDESDVGPFSHLRKGTVLGTHVHVGDFVELKNTSVGDNTKIAHHSYIGDSTVGVNVNVGSGFSTANYDGADKHRAVIGDNVFIGCGVIVISPLEIGSGAYIAAGSTLTENVPEDALGIARVRQEIKYDWKK